MESVSKIRRWVLVEGRSIRSVARATGLSRNTIKKYLKDENPPSYQRHAPPVRHKLCNGFDLRLQELFDQDSRRPRRERRTAQKLYEQLVAEGYTGSYSPVQRFVRELKRAGPVREMRLSRCILRRVTRCNLTGAKNGSYWVVSSRR
ncbi:hypothetical protein [Profundibacter sp.]|uniref:hypothetical protein n=1 Tax=Profundibacter sp. TaxID=3101071 RepID=UPI003D0ED51F